MNALPNDTQIEHQLLEHITLKIGTQESTITRETPLISGSYLDSLSILDFVEYIERAFEIRLDADDLSAEKLDTVALVTSLINEKRAQGSV